MGAVSLLTQKANGEGYAWGRNNYGQLGLGIASQGGFEAKPQRVHFTYYVDADGNPITW